MIEEYRVGEIGNYYGSLHIKVYAGDYYWSIGDWDGHQWEQIPEYLYDSLMKFRDES